MSKEVINGNRRADRRYEFELQLQLCYVDEGGAVHVGRGVTAELSGGGVRFYADDPPPTGAAVEARIAWPFLLQGVCPLEVVVNGTILGTTNRGTVLRFRSYEFRTCGDRSFSEEPLDPPESRVA